MNSAIYCAKPGADTGRMMMSYPQTGVGVDRATEELLIPMRMYIGAGVVDKSQLIILNDVQGAGFIKGHGAKLCKRASRYNPPTAEDDGLNQGDDLVLMAKLRTTPWTDLFEDPLFVFMNYQFTTNNTQAPFYDIVKKREKIAAGDYDGEIEEKPLIPYCGTVCDSMGKIVYENNGHFEGDAFFALGCPCQCADHRKLHGRSGQSQVLRPARGPPAVPRAQI